jgi:hypothetical protein
MLAPTCGSVWLPHVLTRDEGAQVSTTPLLPHVHELMARTERPGTYEPSSAGMAHVAETQEAYHETPEEVRLLLQGGAIEALRHGFYGAAHVLVTELALGEPQWRDWLAVAAARDFVTALRDVA